MPEIRGKAAQVAVSQESGHTVLRFVVQASGGTPRPVEMRGRRLQGVLNNGDDILLTGRPRADRYGVLRPSAVKNLSHHSWVRVTRRSVFSRALGFVAGVFVSVSSGALSAWLTAQLQAREDPRMTPRGLPETLAQDGGLLSLPLLIGAAVALAMFLLLWRFMGRR